MKIKNWRIKSKHSEEESEEKEKKVERRIWIPVHKFQKGKTFLIIFNLFYTYSRGESSADKRSKDYNSIKKKVSDDELKVIKKESSRKEVDDELEVIKRKSSKKEIEEELDVIKEKSSWKLNSIKKEVDDK